ncbi:MAG: permease-like cell division protein FtsX [Betaproteobacteria bacterium]
MSAILTAHLQALTRALARMRRQPLATTLSIAVMAVAIMLPFGLYMMFDNVSAAAAQLNTEPNVNVYLLASATDTDAKEVERKIRAHPNAARVVFLHRETALADLKKRTNLGDLLAGIDVNPLPHAFAIRPHASDTPTLEAMRRDLSAMPKVENVTMDFEWAKKLTRFAQFAERLVLLLGLLLAAAVVFITGNTIRLQMLTQKDEIIVARLIGATRRFVRRPLLYFGAMQGALAGALAVIATAAIGFWVGGEVSALAVSYGGGFSLRAPSLSLSGAVLAVSATLGWLGAFVSVSMYWRQIERAH